jgi:transposase
VARKNTLMHAGNKNDRADARKVAELLYLSKLNPVYQRQAGIRMLEELARSYLAITRDLTSVMNLLKANYRSWGIACTGKQVFAARDRSEWVGKIEEAGVCRRAEFYYQQFDALRSLGQQVRRDLLAESEKRSAWE